MAARTGNWKKIDTKNFNKKIGRYETFASDYIYLPNDMKHGNYTLKKDQWWAEKRAIISNDTVSKQQEMIKHFRVILFQFIESNYEFVSRTTFELSQKIDEEEEAEEEIAKEDQSKKQKIGRGTSPPT